MDCDGARGRFRHRRLWLDSRKTRNAATDCAAGEERSYSSGWPTRAADRPISGVCSEKIDANHPGLGTIEGLNALQPDFISCQVPSWQSLMVSLVTSGSGRIVVLGTVLPSRASTASLSARPPE